MLHMLYQFILRLLQCVSHTSPPYQHCSTSVSTTIVCTSVIPVHLITAVVHLLLPLWYICHTRPLYHHCGTAVITNCSTSVMLVLLITTMVRVIPADLITVKVHVSYRSTFLLL